MSDWRIDIKTVRAGDLVQFNIDKTVVRNESTRSVWIKGRHVGPNGTLREKSETIFGYRSGDDDYDALGDCLKMLPSLSARATDGSHFVVCEVQSSGSPEAALELAQRICGDRWDASRISMCERSAIRALSSISFVAR